MCEDITVSPWFVRPITEEWMAYYDIYDLAFEGTPAAYACVVTTDGDNLAVFADHSLG